MLSILGFIMMVRPGPAPPPAWRRRPALVSVFTHPPLPLRPVSAARRSSVQSVIGNLIRSEYEYLMVNTLRGEHATHAADACQSAAIMYVATLVASCVCICSDRGGGKQAIPGKE